METLMEDVFKLTDEFLDYNKSYKRLEDEYYKYGSLTIGLDFDGTIHDYHKNGSTYEDVIDLVRDLKKIGCKVVIWTAYKDLDYVKNYCEEKNVPIDAINEGGIPLPWESKKPFFSALLDDRAGLLQVYKELRALANKILIQKEYESNTM